MRLFATRTQNKRKQKSVKTFTHKTLARVPKFDHYDIKRLTWPFEVVVDGLYEKGINLHSYTQKLLPLSIRSAKKYSYTLKCSHLLSMKITIVEYVHFLAQVYFIPFAQLH